LTSVACLLCYGILSAAFTLVFKRSDPVNWLIGSTAYVFSGVYFPIDLLPPLLRVVSYALPFTYAVRGLRGALMEGRTILQLRVDLLALLGFTAVLLPLSLWAMRRAIEHLKRTGELSHY
jgi:ABC-2 type transport system permease protein